MGKSNRTMRWYYVAERLKLLMIRVVSEQASACSPQGKWLIDAKGKLSVKLAATEEGSVLGLLGNSEPTYAKIEANGANTSIKLTNRDGNEQIVKP